jgi:hypothetical protein
MAAAADEDILALAVSQNATVVTLDADFHAILAGARAIRNSTGTCGCRCREHRPAGLRGFRERSRSWRDDNCQSEKDDVPQTTGRR